MALCHCRCGQHQSGRPNLRVVSGDACHVAILWVGARETLVNGQFSGWRLKSSGQDPRKTRTGRIPGAQETSTDGANPTTQNTTPQNRRGKRGEESSTKDQTDRPRNQTNTQEPGEEVKFPRDSRRVVSHFW